MRRALATLAALVIAMPVTLLASPNASAESLDRPAPTLEEQLELQQLPTVQPATQRHADFDSQLAARLVAREAVSPWHGALSLLASPLAAVGGAAVGGGIELAIDHAAVPYAGLITGGLAAFGAYTAWSTLGNPAHRDDEAARP